MVKAPVSEKAPVKPAARKLATTKTVRHPNVAATPDPHTPITEAERGLLTAVNSDEGFDARTLHESQRVVRPAFLRALLLGRIEGATVPEFGLRSNGLIFEHFLDLSYLSSPAETLPPLWLDNAHFKADAYFDSTRLATLNLRGAKCDSRLSMTGFSTISHAWFDRLECSGGLNLKGADIGGQLRLSGAKLSGTIDTDGRVTGYALSAEGAVIRDDVFCGPAGDDRFQAEGEIRLLGIQIGGQLNLNGAHLRGATDPDNCVIGYALCADRATIKGGVFCRPVNGHRFEAEGGVRLLGVDIGGQLSLSGAHLKGIIGAESHVTGEALSIDGATIKGGVFCTPANGHRFKAEGMIRLPGAFIDGQLNLSGALLRGAVDAHGSVTGYALLAEGTVVTNDILCGPASGDRFEVEGMIRLLGAEIRGQLSINGARLKGAADTDGRIVGDALSLDGAIIRGGVFFTSASDYRFEADGEIRLLAAEIGKQLNLCGARLRGSVSVNGEVTGDALSGDRAVIRGGVFCSSENGNGFEAEGMVRFPGSDIGGQFNFGGASLKGAVDGDGRVIGEALMAARIKVAGETFLHDEITAFGAVVFRGAVINHLQLQGNFHGIAAEEIALDLRDSEIRRLTLRLNGRAGRGRVYLEGASADTVDDLDPQSWGPAPDETGEGLELDLDGFTYRRAEVWSVPRKRTRRWARFVARDLVAENVLDLLDRSFRGGKPCRDHYSPQPFEQAVKALRETGYSRAADEVAVAKREFHRQCGADGPVAAFMSGISLIFFRYGYGPLRASAWTVGFALLGAGLVWLGQASDLLVATVDPGQTAIRCAEVPLSLALDTFLPLVDFGVEARCRVATGLPWSGVAEAFRVTYAIVGWLFIPMVALTFSGLLRRD